MSTQTDTVRQKLTSVDIRARKTGPKLTMLSLYDFPFARLAEQAGIDIILVGDSLGMVVHGFDSTVPVRLEDIVYHSRAVRRGAPRTHIVADMPFLTYHIDTPRAIENAGRLLQDGGADSVKLEGGREIADRVAAIVRAGIPVMGHIGLTPQSAGALGGKITGAGGGGFFLVCVPPENRAAVRKHLSHLRELPINMERDGSKVIFNVRR